MLRPRLPPAHNFLCTAQADLARLPQILLGVSDAELAAMQRALAHVWHRFLYSSLPIFRGIMQGAYGAAAQAGAAVTAGGGSWHAGSSSSASDGTALQHAGHSSATAGNEALNMGEGGLAGGRDRPAVLLPPAVIRDPAEDDAFMTVMQWLAAKLET